MFQEKRLTFETDMAMAANRVACSAETAVEAAPKIAH